MSLLLLDVFAAVGAAGFLTRLITQDDITDWLRARWRAAWIRRLGPRHRWNTPRTGKAQKFIACHRCVAVWIAVPVTVTAYHAHGAAWFRWPALILSALLMLGLAFDTVAAVSKLAERSS